MRIEHPIDDPELPSYVGYGLRRVLADLQVTRDCWQLLRDAGDDPNRIKRRYMRKEQREPATAYDMRLASARYPTFFPDAIRAFSGILSRFQLSSPPPSLERRQENIDRQGNSLRAFMAAADQGVMRDGGCYVVVDMPREQASSLAEEQAARRAPYLTLVDREDVRSWQVEMRGSSEIATMVVIREWVDVRKGRYGSEREARYRVIVSSSAGTEWTILKMVKDDTGKYGVEIDVDANGQQLAGTYEAAGRKPFPRPPIVWYPSRIAEGFGQGDVTLIGLALDTLDHFRTRGDQKELLRKLSMPVPVRTGMPPPAPGQTSPPVVLGANTFLDLPQGVTFDFKGPSSDSLSPRAKEVEHIEALIREQTLAFMYGQSGGNKTATQAGMEGAQSQSNIRTMTEAKKNVVQQIMQLWVLFTGETLSADAGIVMDANLQDRPLDSSDVQQLSSLAQNELLSEQSVAEILIRGGVNTAVTSAQEELRRIAGERKARATPPAAGGPADAEVINDSNLPMTDPTVTAAGD